MRTSFVLNLPPGILCCLTALREPLRRTPAIFEFGAIRPYEFCGVFLAQKAQPGRFTFAFGIPQFLECLDEHLGLRLSGHGKPPFQLRAICWGKRSGQPIPMKLSTARMMTIAPTM